MTLAFSDTGGSGAQQMAFSINSGAYSPPETHSTTKTLVLPGADGVLDRDARDGRRGQPGRGREHQTMTFSYGLTDTALSNAVMVGSSQG